MSELSDLEQTFLVTLCEIVEGQTASSFSMYDIGDKIGLDRDSAKKTAEDLIGQGFMEIRTLSGAVGLTDEGLAHAQGLGAGNGQGNQTVAGLANAPVVSAEGAEAVTMMAATLKLETTTLNLSFDSMAEVVADLNTLAAQLNSPKPKTVIIKACLTSLQNGLAQTTGSKAQPMIAKLLEG
jgi:hypothetical protein